MTEKSKSVISRVLNILGWVLFGFLVLVILLLLFFGLMNRKSLFGLRAYTVLSDSMQAVFPAGSLIVSQEVDPDTLVVGDIITFTRESDGETVTHKIGKIEEDSVTGYNVYYTYGTTTGEYDEDPVHRNYIQGKYVFHIAGAGYFIQFIKSPLGYVLLILIPFALLIVSQGVKVVRNFRLYQEEGKSEIRTERQKLEDEREETRRLLDELKKMQQQLQDAQNGNTAPTSEDSSPTEQGKEDSALDSSEQTSSADSADNNSNS
ncbi:MAG: signal peptidase I [Clostridia bacterium]|nr:signal peptidase I [Clostridia bacterium]